MFTMRQPTTRSSDSSVHDERARTLTPSVRRSLVHRLLLLATFGGLAVIALPATAQDPVKTSKPAELERSIQALISKGSGEVAVAYCDVVGGEEVYVNADERFHPASTMKVPVMMEVFRQAAEGKLPLDSGLTLKNDFKSIADDSRFAIDAAEDSETTLYRHLGTERTVRELVHLMITESSNLATNLLVERVTAARISALMQSLGAGDVRVLRGVEDSRAFARGLNNETTARGLATIFRQLAAHRVGSPNACDEMLGILRAQKFNEGIPAGLPPGTSVAHKTGSITAIYHDAGVIEPRGQAPYVLVVLTRGFKDRSKAQELVAQLSRTIYEHRLSR